MLDWVITALELGSRDDEVIALLLSESNNPRSRDELVTRLMNANRLAEAKKAAVEGYRQTVDAWPGIAHQLQERLAEIAHRENNPALAATYLALEFFQNPSLGGYQKLETATKAFDTWPQVREAVLHFLKTGARPDVPPTPGSGKKASANPLPWPLPPIDIPPERTLIRNGWSNADVLLRIALHEKRFDDVVRLYESGRKDKTSYFGLDNEVAGALQATHPEVSIAIYKHLADEHIMEVKLAAYEVAAGYLKKIKTLYLDAQMEGEWLQYLQAIKTTHKAKRRLMEILNVFEGKRIIEM